VIGEIGENTKNQAKHVACTQGMTSPMTSLMTSRIFLGIRFPEPLLSLALAPRRLEPRAMVPVDLRRVPRPLFGLGRLRLGVPAPSAWPSSGSRSSMTVGPIRVGFEAVHSGEGRLLFGPLW
jgi:hypothetical protein